MSVKKTNSSSDSFRINQTDGSNKQVRKTGKLFQSLLSDLGGQEIEQPETTFVTGKTRGALERIAQQFDLQSEDDIKTAVKKSAEYLVSSRLSEKIADSEEALQAKETVGEFVANDKTLSKKILNILINLKSKV